MSVTCSNGHENLDGMSFCEDCGVELTSLTDTVNAAPPLPTPPDSCPAPIPAPVPPVTPDPVPGAVVAGSAYLEVTQGPFVGRRFTVTEPVCLIGRWDMDSGSFPQIDLTDVDVDAKVSRKHARISKDGAGYHLEDLGSLNGTSHQGSTRLVPGDLRQLSDGDVVIIGRLFLRFATS